MPQRAEMLSRIERRAVLPVPDGEPIIPDGPIATTQDIQEFKSMVEGMGYEAKFGQAKAVTTRHEVHLTPRCTVGVLTDEFLHVWNNYANQRGQHLENPNESADHRFLGTTFRLSGGSNDRRFHQFELRNFVRFLVNSGGPIPGFIWRTFSSLKAD